MSEDRFTRQELLFGREGQAAIRASTVGLVGLGGLGSHVAQQLAYLGIGCLTLIDHDTVTNSNLNRLVGASARDVGRLKVAVAEELIHEVDSECGVITVAKSVISDDAFHQLAHSDVVFGCVDNDASRVILNEFCQAYARPYFDLASDIHPGEGLFGGRVLLADGRACVQCKGLLNDEAVRWAFASDVQRKEDDQMYGIRREALDLEGPAVVSLNGVIASLAVTEFIMLITKLRDPTIHLEYRGMQGVVARDNEVSGTGCYFCTRVRGSGPNADVERYVREAWGERLG